MSEEKQQKVEEEEAAGVAAMRTLLAADGLVENQNIDTGFSLCDVTLRRYLRARKGDVPKAVAMLKDTIAWRKEFDLQGMHDGKWDEIIQNENATGKMYCRGMDREGHMLVYMNPKFENTNDHAGNTKHVVYNLEKAIASMVGAAVAAAVGVAAATAVAEAVGEEGEEAVKDDAAEAAVAVPVVEKICLVIDYDGYSLMNAPPMKTSKEILSILQNHYPERLHRAYCLRSPWVMSAFWAVIRPFIDPVTTQKLVMLDGNAASFRAALGADIDPAHLEHTLGGDDTRPFHSGAYLSAPYHHCFLQTLNTDATATPTNTPHTSFKR
jgi:hypothetical protein